MPPCSETGGGTGLCLASNTLTSTSTCAVSPQASAPVSLTRIVDRVLELHPILESNSLRMLPAKRNKVDLSKLTEEEQKLFRLYGKLPSHKNVLTKMQKDRKYFDSGDYALSKAGKAPQNTVGTAIPNPDNIPHASATSANHSLSVSPTNISSPIKESPLAEPESRTSAETEEEEQH
ncbi:hypothetical protein NLI96_g12378 [Meripilus lineatus]|uniref:mRNA stability protein n=1 Tax=Meripilus lineatus TaxID=2056292 RepID=A0AAD5YCG2_9APHY|nr:hypothetical protein NLI96_g12378 [Physisporinus lineatus]